MTDYRHCIFHIFYYFCTRINKKGSRMSDICAKNRIFAPSFFGMTYILMEARKAYFRVDESRQLTKESGIRETLSPSVGCIPITYRIWGVSRSII